MAIVANGSNYLAIMAQTLAVAQSATFTNPIQGTKSWLLPFSEELGQTPHLTVRYPDFEGYGNPRTLLPTRGAQYSRIQGGIGRFFTYRLDVIVLYDYKPDSTAVTTVENAFADLYGPFGLEVTFQQNPTLNNVTTESRVIDLKCCNAQRLGIYIANRPLWASMLSLEVADQQKVDYSA